MKRLTLWCLSFFYFLLTLQAQPICEIKDFSINDGLTQGIITSVIQDHKGFIWLGTWNGLNKFDGHTFKNYKSFISKESALPNSRITFMAETAYGDIWCKTYDNKAYIFNTQSESFIDVLKPIEVETQRNNIVEAIYPLKEGIAWVVCDKGYCFRIDEKKYKERSGITLYSTYNGHLKGEQILNIYQDSDKDEWILTNKGITILGKKTIDSDFPFKLITEHKNNIYLISTSEKLAIYDHLNRNVKFIEIPYPVNAIHTVSIIAEHTLALATDNGIILFHPETKGFRQIDIRSKTQPSNHVVSIYEDKQGELWAFSTTPGVTRIEPDTGIKEHLYTPDREVVRYERDSQYIIFEDNQQTLWVVPFKGNLSYYDRKNKQLKPFFTEPDNPRTLFTPLIRNLNSDIQGNVWLSSTRGVKKMSFYPPIYHLERIDEGFELRAFLSDQSGRLWVASKSGFVRIYDSKGNLQGYLSPEGRVSKNKVAFSGNVYCFSEEENGNIWLGTKATGLFYLKKTGNDSYTVRNYRHDPNNNYSLSHNDIFSIYTDSLKNTWIGCYGGGLNLLQQTPEGNIQFIHNRNKLKNYPTDNSLNIRYITEVKKGVVLIGTTDGLISFSSDFDQPEEIKFYQNRHNPDRKSSLVGSDVMHIYTDSYKNTYILTFAGGINKIISKQLLSDSIQFKTYTTQNGLVSDLIISMIEDSDRNLWIAQENALSKFNPTQESFDNYDKSFLRNDFNFTEAIPTIDAEGQLIFGTNMGTLKVVPERMKKSSYVPPIVFTNLMIHGKQSDSPIDDLQELALQPAQRNITIHFSALDYQRPEEIRYAYRLEGLEKRWNKSEKSRSANYINLPTGEYKLQVKSTNSDGVWVDNIRTLKIKVLPTFWETPYAWAVYIVAFILFTLAIVYVLFYIYRLRHQVEMEHQISNIKLRFFTDISHELRTPLTLISSPVTEVLENEPLSPAARQHLTLVHKNTDRMLRLVNQILDFRKIQNRKMKILAENTELIAFLMKITESFRLIAEEKEIDYTFDSDREELFIWIDRDKFEKIIFNLLSNAFKYTLPRKSIKVTLRTEAEFVLIAVIDQGIGIAHEKQESLFKRFETLAKYNILQPSSGIGLSLVKELVEMHHGHIEVESQPGVGSQFQVTFPLNREILEKDSQVELILADSLEHQEEDTITHTHPANIQPTEKSPHPSEEMLLSILVVEDNPELRTLLKTILSGQYSVIEASNGEEGLKKASEMIPDMIISDVMMPVVDGLDMVKQIKENKDICHIPIIILSAKSSLDDRITGLEQGIDDYITKPFSSTYLKARISSLFTQRKYLQHVFLSKLSENKQSTGTVEWEPSKPQIMPHDEQFMKQVMEFMEQQMDNPDLIIDDFAIYLSLSRSIFYRKLKSIVGLTPVDFIREIRLKRATQLIDCGLYTFSQIAYMTGFNDPKYFSKCFKKYKGVTPSEYKEKGNNPSAESN